MSEPVFEYRVQTWKKGKGGSRLDPWMSAITTAKHSAVILNHRVSHGLADDWLVERRAVGAWEVMES